MREVRISDITMKQAANGSSFTLSFKEKLEVAKQLDRLGVSSIEVEGIEREKVDSLRIKSIASIVRNSVLAVPVTLEEGNAEMVWKALSDAERPRLQVEVPVNTAQMEYLHHKKPAAMKEAVVEAIKTCTGLCDDVEFIADDATRADGAYLREIVAAAIEAGAKTVTVCDAAGKLLPEEFARFLADLRADVPALADVALGVSCSDELFMADACAIAACIAGADEVKASAYPAGVVKLGRLCKIMAEKGGAFGITTGVHATEIKRASAGIARICEAGSSSSLFAGGQREPDEGIVLTAHDSVETVMACVAKLGYDLSDEDVDVVYEAFLRIASKKESVGSRELDAIVASAALQVPPTYKIERYVVTCGNVISATASILVRKGDELIERVAMGDGPIDAAFAAIEQISGKRYELDDWQMSSVTEGQEALGEAVIKLIADGKVYSGRGLSTDIVGSTIRAYVNALNKIVYEEQN